MTKVFRIHKKGTSGVDWFNVNQYNDSVIQDIKDPNGLTPKFEITSIPTPFARIDLVKSAFEYVVRDINENGNDPKGKTIYHKLVAETLDIAEILFNYELFKDKIEIIAWEPKKDLNQLTNSDNPAHKLLGNTLQTYWYQDGSVYNFNKVHRLFIIKYEHSIIGGTSPVTLFFPSPDIPRNLNIMLGNNKLFDNIYDALYTRDPEFIKYLKILFEKIEPSLKNDMTEVYEYVNANIEYLKNEEKKEVVNKIFDDIDNFNTNDYEKNMNKIDMNIHGNYLEILGINFRAKKVLPPSDSDFIIDSKKYRGIKPLVLQNGFNEALNYANGTTWNNSFKVPEKDEKPLNERILPGLPIKYPYLTIGDFLEDYLIRLPYKLNSADYFDGNLDLSSKEDLSYVLPLKKDFFDFFNIEDLMGETSTGKKIIEIKRVAGGNVKVYLKVPIQKGKYIEFRKTYSETAIYDQPNAQIEYPVSIGIMPFIKVPEDNDNKYLVQLIDGETEKKSTFKVIFFDTKNNIIESEGRVRTKKQESLNAETVYYEVNGRLSYLQIENSNLKGVLIPKLHQVNYPGVDEMTFAVDFGTTNTHIEYSINNNTPIPFEINKDEFFYRSTLDLGNVPNDMRIFTQYSNKELFPPEINKNSGYTSFPIRTALNQNQNVDFGKKVTAFIDANIAFFYEVDTQHLKEKIYTNLKWSDYSKGAINPDRIRVEKYLEELIILMRIKIIHSNGNLNNVKIKWLYPSSMLPARRKSLETLWNSLVKKWISNTAKVYSYSESIAPFFYFREYQAVSAAALPVASLDIGGATTDIVLFERNQPKTIASFRYAANSLFGDGYGGTPSSNGFVNKYENEFKIIFQKNNNLGFPYSRIYKEIASRRNSSDIVSFFFSLENRKSLKEIKDIINFDQILNQDDEFKIVFILFYTSLIYHLASMMKKKRTKKPRYITFSGNGAKVLYIINGNNDNFDYIEKLTQLIFDKIYDNKENNYKIKLILPDEPKVITSKGCVEDKNIAYPEVENLKEYLLAGNIYNDNNSISYQNVFEKLEEFSSRAIEEYKLFIKFMFELNKEMSFQKYFNIQAKNFDFYNDVLLNEADIKNYYQSGLDNKVEELGNDLTQSVEETDFFYILNGMLNKLAEEIYKKKEQ